MAAESLAEFETLKLELEDGIALLTLNRPEKLNAFNPLMNRELIAAFDLTDATDEVRAVIVTGAGRGFCAGADLAGGGSTFDFDSRTADPLGQRTESGVYRDGGGLVSLRIYESLKPVIAAVNGAAVGVGATMQLPMDIRLASTDAHRADSRGIQARGASADSKEGVESFLQKRPPAFPDKVSDGLPDIWPDWAPPEFS